MGHYGIFSGRKYREMIYPRIREFIARHGVRQASMTKPVTPQDMFDMWQKMVNPGAYPLQSLMFPVLDAKELEKKIAELEAVEHWLKANLNMLQLTIKSLQYQRAMLKGGEKAAES